MRHEKKAAATPTSTPRTNTGGNGHSTAADLSDRLPTVRRAKRRVHQPVPAEFTPKFWQDLDRRLHPAKEIVRRVERLKRDSGADSYQKELLCERAAFVSVVLETFEVEAGQTGRIDLGAYVQAVNSLVGLLRHLGLEKRAKAAGLTAYLGGTA
ncbi:MAG TPA: hypothetical protein VGF55_02025 [Gemmataceae bacterium]